MAKIKLEELTTCKELEKTELSEVRGGISMHLQRQLNQFQANLYRNAQVVFNPYYQLTMIQTAQRASRALTGRQMPWNYRLSWM